MEENRGRMLHDAVVGTKTSWKQFRGSEIGGIYYPVCLQRANTIRIPWQVGDKIEPIEPLLLYRYINGDGGSYLELTLDELGNPIMK